MTSKKETHKTYQSLSELVTILSNEESVNYADIFRSIELTEGAFEDCVSWSDESYTRNCIAENGKFELLLLCWEKGQATAIHDHGGEECWVKVIEGELSDTIYKVDKFGKFNDVSSNISKKGDVSYMADFIGFHRLENLSETRSMSLHLYAKPIKSCNTFDEGARKLVPKDLAYDKVFEFGGKIK